MVRGDYVRCMFPFRESAGPGPSSHIVLVAATATVDRTPAAIVVYTTSRTHFAGAQRPHHLIHVDERRATALGQQTSFDIDVSRIALLPITEAYFPELSGGVVPTYGHDKHVVAVFETRMKALRAEGHRVEPVRLVGGSPKPGSR